MPLSDYEPLLGAPLLRALAERGFEDLTAIQRAVIEADTAHNDLRMSSQTGSGKTVALGLALRHVLLDEPSEDAPRALVITPTRELAKQVEGELAWLYAGTDVRTASVTGGSSYRVEIGALSRRPAVVVGTPGRLLDHLQRGTLKTEAIGAVALDEADRMLDMGFRDELDAIFAQLPAREERRTHLVSATFSREVQRLAASVQPEAVMVEGTPLGSAHADIEHLVHLVAPGERIHAINNLLLHSLGAPTLVFVKMRAEVSEVTEALRATGFRVRGLSGDLEQRERNRALNAFRSGELHALVATDVAARGIDVQDVGRVIHAEPPTDVDDYTHRSGRTGRAGRKGVSSVLVTPAAYHRTMRILEMAEASPRVEPVPGVDVIEAELDRRLLEELAGPTDDLHPHSLALAARLLAGDAVEVALAHLIDRLRKNTPAAPKKLTEVAQPPDRSKGKGRFKAVSGGAKAEGRRRGDRTSYVSFRVSWGSSHGADTRRMLAMICRRGAIRGSDVGAIKVLHAHSVVDVAAGVASSFAEAAGEPDPRDPRIRIEPFGARRNDNERSDRAPQERRASSGRPPYKASDKHASPKGTRPSKPGPAQTAKPSSSGTATKGAPPPKPSTRGTKGAPPPKPSTRGTKGAPPPKPSTKGSAPPKPSTKGSAPKGPPAKGPPGAAGSKRPKGKSYGKGPPGGPKGGKGGPRPFKSRDHAK